MTPEVFRLMVEEFLRRYGKDSAVNGTSDIAQRTLARAQQVVLGLCEVGDDFRTVSALDRVFASWEQNDWRNGLPTGEQLVDHACLMRAGRVICAKAKESSTPTPPPLTFKMWCLSQYGTDLLSIIVDTHKTSESAIRSRWQRTTGNQ
jgi:hypothetical protein